MKMTDRTATGKRPLTLQGALILADERLRRGRPREAESLYRQVLSAVPGHPLARHNLAALLHGRGEWAAAVTLLEKILETETDFIPAHLSLGVIRHGRGELAAAEGHYRRVLSLQADHADALSGLGVTLQARGAWAEAETVLRRALQRKPDHADAHSNLGVALLRQGRFEEGWREYGWRWRTRAFNPLRRFRAAPVWDGEPLHGQRLLVRVEQGVGDTIQFARFLPRVAARGGSLIFQHEPACWRLFRDFPGVAERLTVEEQPPPFDRWVSLLALPGVLGCTLETIPAPISFPGLAAVDASPWRQRIPDSSNLTVGLVWAGDPTHANDHNRSIDPSRLQPLLALPGIDFFSLQVGPAARQLETLADFSITDLGPHLHDYADTAAAMARLDLIITVDTSCAHLAATLNRPTWILIPFAPDWRWLLSRSDSPWYPNVHLFRQSAIGDWDGVVERLLTALKTVLEKR